jgi:hypothetical protein
MKLTSPELVISENGHTPYFMPYIHVLDSLSLSLLHTHTFVVYFAVLLAPQSMYCTIKSTLPIKE